MRNESPLQQLRDEMSRYEKKFMEISEYRDLVERFNNLVKENPSEEEIKHLLKMYFKFEKAWEHAKILPAKKTFAMISRITAYVSLGFGLAGAISVNSILMFALIFVISIFILREATHTERYYFIPRETKDYSYPTLYPAIIAITAILSPIVIIANWSTSATIMCFFFLDMLIIWIILWIFNQDVKHDMMINWIFDQDDKHDMMINDVNI